MILRVGGVVLCGGESSRMGTPKAWLPVGPETMLGRIVRLLGEVVSEVVVVAAPDQSVPPLPEGVVVVRDRQAGRGPMQGLQAGLSALPQSDSAYVSSCDVPLLEPAFVRRMIEQLGEYSIAVPEVAGRRHPLAAAYRMDVLGVVERLLASDRLRLMDLFDEVPTRFVSESDLLSVDPGLRSLRNVNSPDDYESILREINRATDSWIAAL